MTLLNFTFQETSPLISYSAGWGESTQNASLDPSFSSYNGSFRLTQVAQSTASFTFLGTAVSLFSAKRSNHGNYTVQLDLQPLFMASGFADPDVFNQSLWHADHLAYAQHTLTLTNVPLPPNNMFLDLDFVSIERHIGQPGDTIYQLSLDDASPSVNYVGHWHSTTGVSSAYQGTLHGTQDANAQVTFSFKGASLEVYGQYANAPYTVILDNGSPVSLKGLDVDLTPNLQHPQTLLYLVDGLSDGVNHTVTLINNIANANRSFFFDYAVVSSTFNLNATSSPLNVTSPLASKSSGGHSRQTPAAAIAGGVIGALAVIVILGISVFIGRKRGRARNERRRELIESEDHEVTPYIPHTAVHSSDEPREQRQSQPEDRSPPPIPRNAHGSAPRSKHRSAYHLSNPADQARPESDPNSHVDTAPMSTTSASSSQPLASRSGSTSGRQKQTLSRSLSSRGRVGSSREATFQEEDAGIVIDPEEMSMLKPLPPAYNPTWGQN